MAKGTKIKEKQNRRKADAKLFINRPMVMGIINISNDSFYEGSRTPDMEQVLGKAEDMLRAGADILDIGAMSTRPGAEEISEEEEIRLLLPVVKLLHASFPNALLSVDTYRSGVALAAAECGASIINDISAGTFDKKMLEAVASTHCTYIAMHCPAKPKEMQEQCNYTHVGKEVLNFLEKRIRKAKKAGIKEIWADPGFGFGKNLPQNYRLLADLKRLQALEVPILVGLSRKSMIYKTLECSPNEALNGTSVLHGIALWNGAQILRVHDVAEAVEAITLFQMFPKK